MVVAQDLESAQFDGMPRAAIETGVVHHTVPPQEMPRVLLDHAGHRFEAVQDAVDNERPQPRGLDALFRVLETEFGIDFNHYKPSFFFLNIARPSELSPFPNHDAFPT